MTKNRNLMLLIITADDFGISPGVNQAVIKAHLEGALTNASIMANGDYVVDAVRLAQSLAPNLKLGLHINLTGGAPISPLKHVPHLINSAGNFKYGPVALLLQTIINPHILKEIEHEIMAQFRALQQMGVVITHLDGHHHVQMIPGIFKIVVKLAKENNIAQIRVVNESVLNTIYQTKNWRVLCGVGLAKYALLKFLCLINNYKTDTYFFSILNSCMITPTLVKNLAVPSGFSKMELMLHPGMPEIDADIESALCGQRRHLTSEYRRIELDVALQIRHSRS